jgi:hypothetical protein
MSEIKPYGFELIYFKEYQRVWYEVRDLATSEIVFEVGVSDTRKIELHLQSPTGKDILSLKKISNLSNVYRYFKNDVRYATFSYSMSCCRTDYEIQTENKTYIGTGFIGNTLQFVNKNGKVAFEIHLGFKKFKVNIVVEVFDTIEPEIAVLVAVLLHVNWKKNLKNETLGNNTQIQHYR